MYLDYDKFFKIMETNFPYKVIYIFYICDQFSIHTRPYHWNLQNWLSVGRKIFVSVTEESGPFVFIEKKIIHKSDVLIYSQVKSQYCKVSWMVIFPWHLSHQMK